MLLLGHELLLLAMDGGRCGSVMEDGKRRKKKMTARAYMSAIGGGLECNISICIHLQLGSSHLHTYLVAFLWEVKNYNGIL